MASLTQWHEFEQTSGRTEEPGVLQSMESDKESDIIWRLNNRILTVAQHGSCSEKVKE